MIHPPLPQCTRIMDVVLTTLYQAPPIPTPNLTGEVGGGATKKYSNVNVLKRPSFYSTK